MQKIVPGAPNPSPPAGVVVEAGVPNSPVPPVAGLLPNEKPPAAGAEVVAAPLPNENAVGAAPCAGVEPNEKPEEDKRHAQDSLTNRIIFHRAQNPFYISSVN
jgi:hypothetical protein